MSNKTVGFEIFKDNEIDNTGKSMQFPIYGEEFDMDTNQLVPNAGIWVRMIPNESQKAIEAVKYVSGLEDKANRMLASWEKSSKYSDLDVLKKKRDLKINISAQLLARMIVEFFGDMADEHFLGFKSLSVKDRAKVLKTVPNLIDSLLTKIEEIESGKFKNDPNVYAQSDIAEAVRQENETMRDIVEDTGKKSGQD